MSRRSRVEATNAASAVPVSPSSRVEAFDQYNRCSFDPYDGISLQAQYPRDGASDSISKDSASDRGSRGFNSSSPLLDFTAPISNDSASDRGSRGYNRSSVGTVRHEHKTTCLPRPN